MFTFLPAFQGTLIGGLVGFSLNCWIVFGAFVARFRGELRSYTLPTSTSNCTYNFNATVSAMEYNDRYVLFIFKIKIYTKIETSQTFFL